MNESGTVNPGGGLPRIVVVDDDAEIRALTSRSLSQHGFSVTTVADGGALRRVLGEEACDLIVLDLMLPGESGLDICREIRGGLNVPIIMLTALGEESDRVVGLEMGADDYLAKPFSTRELVARIRAVLRRTTGSAAAGTGDYRFGGWTLEVVRRRLMSPDGTVVRLTGAEFDLLLAFLDHAQAVLSRDQLSEITRGRSPHLFDRSIDVLIGRLRRKLEPDPREPTLLQTVRNGGYVLSAAVERG
ncbi:MAG: response regulator [Alphaproteobacteria bacterium]